MRPFALALCLLALAVPGPALADPTGKFSVVGMNPNTGEEYTGKVRVSRNGETYKVVWTIAGQRLEGIGVGVRLVDGQPSLGPASADDSGISIAYGSGDSTGTVVYFEQADGTWHGIWAYSGSTRIATEEWIPDGPKVVSRIDKAGDKNGDKANPAVREITPKGAVLPLSTPMPALAGPKS